MHAKSLVWGTFRKDPQIQKVLKWKPVHQKLYYKKCPSVHGYPETIELPRSTCYLHRLPIQYKSWHWVNTVWVMSNPAHRDNVDIRRKQITKGPGVTIWKASVMEHHRGFASRVTHVGIPRWCYRTQLLGGLYKMIVLVIVLVFDCKTIITITRMIV